MSETAADGEKKKGRLERLPYPEEEDIDITNVF